MIDEIYEALKEDILIADTPIKYYQYPATGDMSGTYVVIDPLDVPIPSDYADNDWMTDEFLYQIEVWSKSPAEKETIANRIRDIMWDLNFSQGSGADEYDKDLKIYRDARQYRGKKYVQGVV